MYEPMPRVSNPSNWGHVDAVLGATAQPGRSGGVNVDVRVVEPVSGNAFGQRTPRGSVTSPFAPRPMGDLTFRSLHESTVSVVIPARNEERNLPHVLPNIPQWVHEVILVDGHSTDATIEVAERLLPTIRVIQQLGNGKGAALRTGFAATTGDIVVMLDADGSMDPAEIPAYVGQLLAGSDFVKGTRFAQGGGTSDMTNLRRVGNWGLTQLVRGCFGGRFTDLCYGYVAFWRDVLPVLSLCTDGFEIETEMNLRALRAGLCIAEVPSFEAERIHGASNLRTFVDGWKVLKTIAGETVAKPMRPSVIGGAGRRGTRDVGKQFAK